MRLRGESVSRHTQQPSGKNSTRQTDAKARERKQAIALLVEAAEVARSFGAAEDRAEVQALAADALWPFDPQSARAIFARAWTAAKDADREMFGDESAEQVDENTEPEQVASTRFPLLRVAARHDPQLAEKLLHELIGDESRAAGRAENPVEGETRSGNGTMSSRRRSPWREPGPESEWRFVFVRSLIGEGEYERAAQMAAPLAEEGVSARLMFLLHDLRPNAAQGADAIYVRLLERTLSDGDADANDVLLLSSYVVSPRLLVVVDDRSLAQFAPLTPDDSIGQKEPPQLAPRVRALFYRTAANVLLRPSAPDATPGEQAAHFFAVNRLLPFFEREATQHAAALNARRAALAAEIDDVRRERLSTQAGTHAPARSNPRDPLGPQLETIAHTKDERARDRLRFHAVRKAASLRLFDRARVIAEEIGDPALRDAGFFHLNAERILSIGEGFKEDEDKNDWERAAALVRGADTSPLVRAVGLSKAAALASRRGKRELAAELLVEAARFAGEVKSNATQRYGVFATLTLVASRIDAAQAWELLHATINAANEVENYMDFHTALMTDPVVEGHTAPVGVGVSPLPQDVFAALARLDFARAISEARALKNAVARSHALVAVARVRLRGAEGARKALD